MAEEVVPAPVVESTPGQLAREQKEVFDGILKYLRQIDETLKKASPTDEPKENVPVETTRVEKENTRVETQKLTQFFDSVRVWDTEKMISMIQEEPQLMLEISTWGETVCTVFHLAIILISEELLVKMSRIAISRLENPQQLFNGFRWKSRLDFDVEVIPVEVASIRGTKGIMLLVDKFGRVNFDTFQYSQTWTEKQQVLARLCRILDSSVKESIEGGINQTQGGAKRTVREELVRSGSWSGSWWGSEYGISLPGDEGHLFVLHHYAAGFGQDSPVLQELMNQICQELGPEDLAALLKLTDHNGLTPVHLLFDWSYRVTPSADRQAHFFEMVKKYCDSDFNVLDVRDSMGRTCVHVTAALSHLDVSMSAIAELDCDRFRSVLDARCGDPWERTALHLAVINNQNEHVKTLVEHGCNVNIPVLFEPISINNYAEPYGWDRLEPDGLVAFQLASIKGHVSILQTLLKDKMLRDKGLIAQPTERDDAAQGRPQIFPALHLAACGDNPLAVKTLLDSGKFNSFARDGYSNTALHFVACRELKVLPSGCCDFVSPSQYHNHKVFHKAKEGENRNRKLGGMIGCMDLLMQAGLDMNHRNVRGDTPQLRESAPDELTRWWYDKLASQNQEAKTNLVAAANAVSVTAALVATTSFVGPLQPPLGLSQSAEAWLTGYSQVNHAAVQFFLFCNNFSFYLAIASIMLAVIPSLTIPREALPLEVQIARRVVQVAVVLLFVSITFVICAFSAASIAVVPESRWHYKAFAVFAITVGALVCLMALCLFLLRLMRLIKPNAKWVINLTNYVFVRAQTHDKLKLE